MRALPPEQHNAFTWYGPDMVQRQDEWRSYLTPDDIAELETAAELWHASHQDIAMLTAKNFSLPTLSPKLAKLREELIRGRGFGLLRGLPCHQYSEHEAATIFYGLGCHLGNAQPQNAQRHVLGHVRDLGMRSSDPGVRVYQTNERQTFHADSADVVGLLCLKTAKIGGLSLLLAHGRCIRLLL